MPDTDFLDALTPRRRAILTAATQVVSDHGLRGLTHRAVDRAAGIAEGSTSAYLRTRHALQLELARFVVASLAEDIAAHTALLADPSARERAAELTTGLFQSWLAQSELQRCRVELTLESARDPELAEVFAASRAHLVAILSAVPDRSGAPRSLAEAETVMAAADGILTHALGRPADERPAFLRASLEWLLTPMLSGVSDR
ncbi:MAG: TetR family transcriptional regulator [Nocardioides sp.]